MRKWILIIVVILIGVIAYNYIYQKHTNVSEERPEYILKVDELKKEFSSNSLHSEQKYLNKILEISGNLSEFNSQQLTLDQIVFCQMKDPLEQTLQRDLEITVKGRFIGYDDLLEQVKLDQCIITLKSNIMKTTLLMLAFVGMVSANAQTTHNLDWEIGANGPEMDLTIDIGDTVIWTWTDALPHTVQNVVGSSVETFNSGTLTGVGQTYSKTFTVEGDNDYFCGIHGAASMSGTITVVDNLNVDENKLKLFSITSNPANTHLVIDLPPSVNSGELVIHNVLGKKVISQTIQTSQQLSIDISNLKQGLYLVSLASEDKKQTQRFLKN